MRIIIIIRISHHASCFLKYLLESSTCIFVRIIKNTEQSTKNWDESKKLAQKIGNKNTKANGNTTEPRKRETKVNNNYLKIKTKVITINS